MRKQGEFCLYAISNREDLTFFLSLAILISASWRCIEVVITALTRNQVG